jgi:hypothetical protein
MDAKTEELSTAHDVLAELYADRLGDGLDRMPAERAVSSPAVARGGGQRCGRGRPGLRGLGVGVDAGVRRAEIWAVSGRGECTGEPRPAAIGPDDRVDTDSVAFVPVYYRSD